MQGFHTKQGCLFHPWTTNGEYAAWFNPHVRNPRKKEVKRGGKGKLTPRYVSTISPFDHFLVHNKSFVAEEQSILLFWPPPLLAKRIGPVVPTFYRKKLLQNVWFMLTPNFQHKLSLRAAENMPIAKKKNLLKHTYHMRCSSAARVSVCTAKLAPMGHLSAILGHQFCPSMFD